MAELLGTSTWAELRDHLFAEAERLSAAEHTNVVRVHSVHHSASRSHVYIVTELCDRSANELCSSGPLSVGAAATALRQSLKGLEALHLRGMVHRDIKPSNLLAKGTTYKLGDFGLVTDNLVQGYASRQGYTEHLAPEVFEVSVTSPTTDVWAMGVTAFRLLNGDRWYNEILESWGVDRTDPVDAAERIEDIVTAGRFPARLQWMPHVSASWRRFVNKALARDTSSRYRDGGAMLSGMNSLDVPDEPSWACVFTPELVTWSRGRGAREEFVEWRRHSPRRHEFVAFTRAIDGPGRRLTLASSKGLVAKQHVLELLQTFFDTRSR